MPTNQGRAGAVTIPAVAAATLFVRPYAKPRTSWLRGRDAGDDDSPTPTPTPTPAGGQPASPTQSPRRSPENDANSNRR